MATGLSEGATKRPFGELPLARRALAVALALSLLCVDVASAVSRGDDGDYSPKSARVSAAPAVSQSVVDAHAADVAAARGLESSRVVSTDEPGPAPLPVDGRVVPAPTASDLAPLPAVSVPADATKPVDVVLHPPVSDRKTVGFDEDTSVELRDRRDAFSSTYQNADGTLSVELSSIPLHFEDGIGGWKDIDNRIVDDGNGGLTNAGNAWHVTFGAMVPGEGISISTRDGDLRFVADGASKVAPTIEPDDVVSATRTCFPTPIWCTSSRVSVLRSCWSSSRRPGRRR